MSGPVIVAGVRPALTVEQQLRREVRELVQALEWFARFQARPHETDNERFERVAETFREETGYLAPGKDCRLHDHEERRDAWEAWIREGTERARALIAKHKGQAS
jgi:hypothetical protein